MNIDTRTNPFSLPRLALSALLGFALLLGSIAPRSASANDAYFSPANNGVGPQSITLASLQGKWAMTLNGVTGCGVGTSYVTFRLNASGSGSATIQSHTAGCGDPVTSGLPFIIQTLNPDGSGTANLSCGTGCGWQLTIQVSRDKDEFSVVDVEPTNPGNYLDGIAIRR